MHSLQASLSIVSIYTTSRKMHDSKLIHLKSSANVYRYNFTKVKKHSYLFLNSPKKAASLSVFIISTKSRNSYDHSLFYYRRLCLELLSFLQSLETAMFIHSFTTGGLTSELLSFLQSLETAMIIHSFTTGGLTSELLSFLQSLETAMIIHSFTTGGSHI